MTSLTDTQLIVLNAAAQRSSLLALPLPPKLKGVAAHKVIHPLIEEGLGFQPPNTYPPKAAALTGGGFSFWAGKVGDDRHRAANFFRHQSG